MMLFHAFGARYAIDYADGMLYRLVLKCTPHFDQRRMLSGF
jgi:hypothetical protein